MARFSAAPPSQTAAQDVIYAMLDASRAGDVKAYLATYGGQGFRTVGRAERHLKVDGRYVAEIIVERFL